MSRLMLVMERAAQKAYGEDSELIGKLAGIINASKFDRGWGPFITGALGGRGTDGLHDAYTVCPCYGADVGLTAVYERKRGETETKASS